MDGVILSACVRRSTRAALRDAFLELWGSDAPMIGCLGIDAPFDPTPHGEKELPGETTWAPEVRPAPAAMPSKPAPRPPTPPRRATDRPAATPVVEAVPSDWGFPESTAPRPSEERRKTARSESGAPMKAKQEISDTAPQALVARLSDEVKRGHVPRPAPSRRSLILVALALLLAVAGAFATFQAMRRGSSRAAAPAETLPAGTEPTIPVDLGSTPGTLPSVQGQGNATDLTTNNGQPSEDAGAAPSEEAPPVSPPAKRTVAGLNYEVHVASFNTEKMGKNLVKRLRDRGLDAWYAKATDQPSWYRVFIGHYATHEEAARQAKSLLDRGLVEHAIAYPNHAR